MGDDTKPNSRVSSGAPSVPVWDLLIRVFHWSLVAGFLAAWITGHEWDLAHLIAGYWVAGLIGLRIVWGFVGARHARFADFVKGPAAVAGFLKDSVLLKAPRYLGHNPAGGAMVVALLVMIAVISCSGYMLTIDAFRSEKWVEELHEIAVNVTLVLVALHVLGVVLASIEHRENLVKAMFTGRKRPL